MSALRLLPASLMLLAACAPIDPATVATTEYLGRLQPLLQENSLLGERLLFQAAAVYNEASRPDMVANAWVSDVVPLAEHLHNQASFVAAPDMWSNVHGELVSIWGDRATAYRNLGEAIRLADKNEWVAARELANGATLREDRWFIAFNEQLAPLGVVADPFP